jgi:hypothetical protein
MATPGSGNTPRSPSVFKTQGADHLRRLGALEPNPEFEALLRKITPDIEGGVTQSRALGQGRVDVPDPAYLQQIAGTLGQSTTDATSLLQLLPDLTLVMNLLTSAILAPKDLTSSEVTFKVDRRAFRLPIAGRLLDVIIDHFTNVYNIKGMCPDALRDIISKTGSYPLMVVPENAVDAMINGSTNYSTESYAQALMPLLDNSSGEYRSLGLLGQGPAQAATEKAGNTRFINAMESLRAGDGRGARPDSCYAKTLESFVTQFGKEHENVRAMGSEFAKTVLITDNYNVVKTSALTEARRRATVNNAIALEADMSNYYGGGGGYANYALGGAQRSRTTFSRSAIVQAIKTNEMLVKPMVGHPLIMRIPSEAVIPVFITPDKHLGYFVLLDADGNPLKLANRKDIYNDLSTSNNGTASSTQGASQMIQMTQNLSIGVNPRENPRDPAQMVRIYGQLLEHELKTRLANGIYGPNARIDVSGEVYQIMLARSLKRQQTQILYVPAELMIYMAFDYAENGTGRSITEQTKIIGAMRAMLGFSNVMAGVKNSVSRQKVTIQLSENDIDPAKTVARVIDEYTRRRNVTMPFVASDPADMISYINMAGVEFNVTGKGAPAHSVEIEDKQTNRAKVDVDLDNMLRDRHYMAYGVTPEAVIASTGADFATSVVTNNQMFAKRVITYQDQFTPFLEQFVRTVTLNSAELMNRLREIVVASVTDLKKEGDPETDATDVVDRTKQATTQQQAVQATNPLMARTAANTEGPSQAILVEYVDPKKPQPRPLSAEEAQLVDQIVFEFIDAIRISLPRPDTATEESQIKALDQHSDLIDKAIIHYLDAAFIGESNLGAFAGHLDEWKAAAKSYLMRQFISNNGIMPELQALFALDEDGNPEIDIKQALADHVHVVATLFKPYLEAIGRERETIKQQADQLNKEFPDAGLTGEGAGGSGAGAGGFNAGGGGEFGNEEGGEFEGGGFGGEGGEGNFGAEPTGGGGEFGESEDLLLGNEPTETGAEASEMEEPPATSEEGATPQEGKPPLNSEQQKAVNGILGKSPAPKTSEEEEEEGNPEDNAEPEV